MGLMDSTCTYGDLVGKYDRFRVPAVKVKAEGKELKGARIRCVSAVLALEGSSVVNFQVTGIYDEKKSGFDPGVKNKLKLGAKITVELGYGSALTPVFQGYISAVGVDFSEEPILDVTAMDVRRLMMEGTGRETVHAVTTYSAAFQEVLKPYKAMCPKLAVDATDAKEIIQITQRASDYDFVASTLAKRAGREFFVVLDTAYFRERAKVKAPILTLKWGEGLLSFSRNALYQNLKITVLGYDPEQKKAIKAQVTEKAADPQKNVGSQHQEFLTDADALEEKKARKRAEEEAWERKCKAQTGTVTTVGIPELVPGRFVKLDGLDKDLNVKYYIREVRHELSEDGFTTTLSIGGWEK